MTEPPYKNLAAPLEPAISQKMLEVSLPPSLQSPNTHSDTRNTSNNFQVRFLGSHMVESDARLDELLQNSSLRAHPTRCTPREGFNLGKLASYAICQELIRNQPTRILFVSPPGYGNATVGRHVGALLRTSVNSFSHTWNVRTVNSLLMVQLAILHGNIQVWTV